MDGTVEIDEFYLGGAPRREAHLPRPGRGRKGLPRATKSPVLTVVQRLGHFQEGALAGKAAAWVVEDLSERKERRALDDAVDPSSHLMSDQWKSFLFVGEGFAKHDTVRHCGHEYARGPVHANSAQEFNDRVRRIIAGVFHHISIGPANLYFHEIGF